MASAGYSVNEMSQERKPASTLDALTSISAAGFKSIVEPQSVEIRPLTILAGANSAGKSSIIQPILLLKQTLEASFDPGPLLLEGPNVAFTSADQFLSRTGNHEGREPFEVGVGVGPSISLRLSFSRQPRFGLGLLKAQGERGHPQRGVQVCEMSCSVGAGTVTVRPEMTDAELQVAIPAWAKEIPELLAKTLSEPQFTVWRNRCFLEVSAHFKDIDFSINLGLLATNIYEQISKLIHLPGWRGNPKRTYPVTGVGATFPGTFENYVASVIANWQTQDKDRLEALTQNLASLGLTWKITAVPVAETRVELRVGRLAHGKSGGDNDLVSIADVGFGVSQAVPVLVALLVAEPGQAVYLEEPEIHLHPRAQRQMARILADAAARGVRVIAETHSSLLLRSIQTLVARGELPPELVKLHWFSRSDKNGATEIRSADLDENGAFGDWPTDFDEVELGSENDYLDAVELRSRA
jgi:putative AbiEii toxin of type IV toxin-antitoxin system